MGYGSTELPAPQATLMKMVVEGVGVDGGACVALTALGAIKNGYKVIVNEAAIGTMYKKNKNKYFKKLYEAGAEFV